MASRGSCGTRVLVVAAALVLFTNFNLAFLGVARPNKTSSILAGSSQQSLSSQSRSGVGMAAFDFMGSPVGVGQAASSMSQLNIGWEFIFALLPAIIVEIVVLGPVQKALEASGLKNPDREHVMNSDDKIPVQIPFQITNWEPHRSPDRFWSTVFSLFTTSSLLPRLQGPLLVLNLVAAFSLFWDIYMVPQGYPKLMLQTLPFTISSFALGLLLAFKANNATARYVKARDLWGDMLNINRDLVQMASQWANREDFIDFARWVPAFTTCLMCGLRNPGRHDLAQELREAAGSNLDLKGAGAGLSEEEIQMIVNRPNGMLAHHYVTHILRAKIKLMDLPIEQRALMENNITRLINDCGACENIFATPIPVGFTKHTTRFLFLWLFFLPFALEGSLGVGVVFAQQLLGFGLLGIEDVGIQIEQPFDVLPLKKICFKISNEAQIVRANFDSLEEDAATSKNLNSMTPEKVPEPA